MTTGPINANDIGIYVGNVLIACLTDAQFSSNKTAISVVCKDYRGSLNGSLEWSLTGSTVVRFDGAYGPDDILEAHMNNTLLNIKFGTDGSGDMRIQGQVLVQQFQMGAGVDSAATCSFTLTGQGEYTKDTNP
jgi:predicted secreted protein